MGAMMVVGGSEQIRVIREIRVSPGVAVAVAVAVPVIAIRISQSAY